MVCKRWSRLVAQFLIQPFFCQFISICITKQEIKLYLKGNKVVTIGNIVPGPPSITKNVIPNDDNDTSEDEFEDEDDYENPDQEELQRFIIKFVKLKLKESENGAIAKTNE